MDVCGSKIRRTLLTIRTLLKSSTSKQDKSNTSKAVPELPLLKAKSRKRATKRRTTKRLPKCSIMRKVSYRELVVRKEAEKVSKRLGVKLRPYKCEYCDYWHLSHKKNKLTLH